MNFFENLVKKGNTSMDKDISSISKGVYIIKATGKHIYEAKKITIN